MNLSMLFGAGCEMGVEQIILIVLLGVMLVVLIVLPMFTNKKRAKAVNELYNSVKVGAVIKTVGGIIGKVTEIREVSPTEKELVVETGKEGSVTTMIFDMQAVYQIISSPEAPAEATADSAAEAPAAESSIYEEAAPEAEAAPEVDKEPAAEEQVKTEETAAADVAPAATEESKPAQKKTTSGAKKTVNKNSSKK